MQAEAAALPSWIKPQLTKLVEAPPEGPGWLHEIKFDGYRMHALLDRGAVRLLTRTGLDWTHKYPASAAAFASFPARQAAQCPHVRPGCTMTRAPLASPDGPPSATSPAISLPGMCGSGFATRAMPRRCQRSRWLRAHARTRTSASPAERAGSGTS